MDDLLDLDWSSSNTASGSSGLKPSTTTTTARPPAFARQNSSSYTFDALTRPGSTATPPLRPSPSPRPVVAAPAKQSSNGAGDAFSSLLDLGGAAASRTATPSNGSAMTLAERQRAAVGLASKPAQGKVDDAWGAVDDWDALLSAKKPAE